MYAVIGPVLNRAGSYAFDCWTSAEGLIRGYAYWRIDDACHARRVEIRCAATERNLRLVICDTLDEFACEIADHEVPFLASSRSSVSAV